MEPNGAGFLSAKEVVSKQLEERRIEGISGRDPTEMMGLESLKTLSTYLRKDFISICALSTKPVKKYLDKIPHDIVPDISCDFYKLGDQRKHYKCQNEDPAEDNGEKEASALDDYLVIHGYKKDITEDDQGCDTYDLC